MYTIVYTLSIFIHLGNDMIKESDKKSGSLSNQSKSTQKATSGSFRPGAKTVSLSTRLSQEDAEFLAGLKVEGATTPSEKLRAVISDTRKRSVGMQDYRGSFLMYQEVLNRVATVTREIEMDHQIHSEMVSRTIEWLPDMMAFVTSKGAELQQNGNVESINSLEDGITDRCFRLIQSILQLGVTETCPCYEPNAVAKRMPPVVSLLKVIQG